jgi:diguanylate cyclase (GGDEF)-like protein/PAS domain S-box-containing protein
MNLDIRTLFAVLILLSFIQTIALTFQYLLNKSTRGLNWWVVGFLLTALGYSCSVLRQNPALEDFAILSSNLLYIGGLWSFYYSISKFLGLTFPWKLTNILLIVFMAGLGYFTLGQDNIGIRRILVGGTGFIITLAISISLFSNKVDAIRFTTRFLAGLFFIGSMVMLLRTVTGFIGGNQIDELSSSPSQIAFYLGILVVTNLWSLGFIIMVNQNLHYEIQLAKHRLETILKTSPDAIILTRHDDGEIIDVNEKFVELTGYSIGEVIGKSTLDLELYSNPTDRTTMIDFLKSDGRCDQFESIFKCKDGEKVHVLLSAQVVNLGGIDHIICIAHDISIRISIEMALRESEEKFRFMTENSSDVIWHTTADYIFDYISPADERMRGFPKEEVLGTTMWNTLKPEGVDIIRSANSHRLQHERQGIQTGIITYELEQKCKEDRWIWTEVTVSPHRNQSGALIGYNGVTREITERKKLQEELHKQATTDELTGVNNRRRFLELFHLELRRIERHYHPLTIMSIDIDHFKKVNDHFGHAAGDEVLIQFAQVCSQNVREIDIVARLGGDEFVIMLPETQSDQARIVAERIQQNLLIHPVDGMRLPHNLFISCGIATLESSHETIDQLLKRADDALYEAKHCGRNQIKINEPYSMIDGDSI